MTLGIGLKTRQVDDCHVWRKTGNFIGLRTAQQVTDEKGMPGIFKKHACTDAVLRVCATEQVLGKQIAAFCVGKKIFQKNIKMRFRHGLVIIPPDG